MRTLHHWPLDPMGRLVRLALGEKKMGFESEEETPWRSREAYLAMDPGGQGVVLTREGAQAVVSARAALEYLEEVHPDPPLLPKDPGARAEARRLMDWFDRKFGEEACAPVLAEKLVKRLDGAGAPDLDRLRAAREAGRWHLDYMAWLLESRDWLGGETMSLADFAAAAPLSSLDYLGEIPWADFSGVKDWYQTLKSRPCFRPILADRLPGVPPADHYDDLDF